MRNFEEVITQITDVLESNGFRECELAIRLHKLRKSSRYTAPEMKLDIFSIFSKKDKEELRLNVVE